MHLVEGYLDLLKRLLEVENLFMFNLWKLHNIELKWFLFVSIGMR